MSIDPGFSHHSFLLESQLSSMQPDENVSTKNKIFMNLEEIISIINLKKP